MIATPVSPFNHYDNNDGGGGQRHRNKSGHFSNSTYGYHESNLRNKEESLGGGERGNENFRSFILYNNPLLQSPSPKKI